MKHCGQCGTALTTAPDDSGYTRQICPACGWAWYDPPTPIVLALVLTAGGQVVYTRKHSMAPGRWTLVAGFIQKGETAEQAAVREALEETGLNTRITRFTGTHVYPLRPDQLAITFELQAEPGVPHPGDDVDEVRVGPPEPELLREGSTVRWLVEDLLRRRQG